MTVVRLRAFGIRGIAAVAVTFASLMFGAGSSCGGELGFYEPDVPASDDGSDEADRFGPMDSGFEARVDVATISGDATDAAEAEGEAGNDPRCPSSYPTLRDDCATTQLGLLCGYAEGSCACGVSGSCGGGCTPVTCPQLKANCGVVGDGCGDVLHCGACPPPWMCGVSGRPAVCASADDADAGELPDGCVPKTCVQLGALCGLNDDGCGGRVNCGTCFWQCSPQTPGCPKFRPSTLGTDPCSQDGKQCSYTSCCPNTFTCTNQHWTLSNSQTCL